MSKDKISDYSTTASNNTDIAGIGIQGTNAVSNFDGAFRTIMKQLADMNAGTSPIFDTFTLCDPADNTKLVRIDAGNVTAGQTRVISVPDASTTIVGTDTTQTITNKTFTDNVTTFADNGDATKKAQFDCSGITTATTRTYTLPNASSTIAVLGLAQNWSASQTFSSTTQFGDLIAKTADNSTLAIYGGTAGLGAHITLAGSTHATVANQGFYDANTHSFRQVGGSGTPSVNIGGNTVWHAGNDGTGSGLDADVLRGLAPDTSATVSTIMQRDGSGNTSVAQLTATALNYSSALTIGDGGEDFRFNSDGFLSNGLTVTKTDITDSGTGLSFQKAGIIWASRSAAALLFLNRDGSDGIVAQFARGKTAVGSISVTTTNTAYNTSSDGRAKINRQPLANSGDVFDALQPLTWDWEHVEGEHGVGFIAQDLHAIVPEAVTPGDSDPSLKPGDDGFEWWSLDMSKLVPYLVAEVKLLRSRVATLESK